MSKSKWIVKAEYTTKKEMEEMFRKIGRDPDEYEIEDFQEVEIAVVREDNKLGIRSAGWDDLDKITLFDNSAGNYDEEDIKWCKEVAETICEALNREALNRKGL